MSISIVEGKPVRYNPLTGESRTTEVLKEKDSKIEKKEKIEDVVVDEPKVVDKKKTSK